MGDLSKMKNILAPSILSADFKVLGEQVKTCAENGAEYLHFDVMDGMFVSNISFGIPVLASIKDAADIVMDVHLMIEEPIRYVEAFHKAGADILNVHYEACEDVQATLDAIHKCGMKAFIPESLDKIRELRGLLNEKGLTADVEVDGGIHLSNAKEVLEAGANVLVAGSAVFKDNIAENVKGFMEILNENE